MWFTKSKEKYFLGSHINQIDALLMQIKYPIEFPRQQRSISYLRYFKATEYRNFLFYAGQHIMKSYLPEPYYTHFAEYVLVMRM